jgi:hypothetical protein
VVKNEKINEIERTRVRSPPRATSLKKHWNKKLDQLNEYGLALKTLEYKDGQIK